MVELYEAGEKFSVYLWKQGEECPILDFLEELVANGNGDAAQLDRRLRQMAHHGPPTRHEIGHALERDTYVLKTSGMSRLIWFYDPTTRRAIVCTHCFRKPANEEYSTEIDKASEIRRLYLAEVEALRKAQEDLANSQSSKKGGARSRKAPNKKRK